MFHSYLILLHARSKHPKWYAGSKYIYHFGNQPIQIQCSKGYMKDLPFIHVDYVRVDQNTAHTVFKT
jgi:hypothetical protein